MKWFHRDNDHTGRKENSLKWISKIRQRSQNSVIKSLIALPENKKVSLLQPPNQSLSLASHCTTHVRSKSILKHLIHNGFLQEKILSFYRAYSTISKNLIYCKSISVTAMGLVTRTTQFVIESIQATWTLHSLKFQISRLFLERSNLTCNYRVQIHSKHVRETIKTLSIKLFLVYHNSRTVMQMYIFENLPSKWFPFKTSMS